MGYTSKERCGSFLPAPFIGDFMVDRVEQGEREMEDEGAPSPPEPMPWPPEEPSEPQQSTDDQPPAVVPRYAEHATPAVRGTPYVSTQGHESSHRATRCDGRSPTPWAAANHELGRREAEARFMGRRSTSTPSAFPMTRTSPWLASAWAPCTRGHTTADPSVRPTLPSGLVCPSSARTSHAGSGRATVAPDPS